MIKVKLMGGLGNQMFQYSLGFAVAKRNNSQFVLDTSYLLDRTPRSNFVFRDFDLDIFKLDNDFYFGTGHHEVSFFTKIINKVLPISFKTYYKEYGFEYNSDIELLNSNNLYFDGYWQSSKYFYEFESDIRSSFVYNVNFDDKVESLRSRILSSESVCLNVRRGDFVNNDFHGTIGIDYYIKSLDILYNKLNKKFKIFVFSDDIEWCKDNLQFDFETEFIDHSYKGFKFSSYLYLMQSCKYFVIPNSSFAWWGAFLSDYDNKIVIAPLKWFNNDFNTSDLIPDTWIRI